MKKTLILIMLLFSGLSLALETCDYVEESNEVSKEDAELWDDLMDDGRPIEPFEQWEINLYMHLLAHDDINIVAMALASFDVEFTDRVDSETGLFIFDQEEKLTLVKKIADDIDANAMSLKIAQSICHQVDISDSCQTDKITEKLFKIEPGNMAIYLYDLSAAVDEDDSDMMKIILKRMSEAKYTSVVESLPGDLVNYIDEYLFENKMPDGKRNMYLDDLISELSESEKELVQYNTLLSSFKMNGMTYLLPALRPLIKACEYDSSHKDYCFRISEILVQKSDSFIMTMSGYGLAVKLNELAGDKIALEESQSASDSFRKYYTCIVENIYQANKMDLMLDPVVLNILLEGTNESKYMEQTAVYLYEKYQKAGIKDLINPKSCGLKYLN